MMSLVWLLNNYNNNTKKLENSHNNNNFYNINELIQRIHQHWTHSNILITYIHQGWSQWKYCIKNITKKKKIKKTFDNLHFMNYTLLFWLSIYTFLNVFINYLVKKNIDIVWYANTFRL